MFKTKVLPATSQEYLIPIFLQALDFFNKTTTSVVVLNPLAKSLGKTAINTSAKTASEQQRLQHSFTLEHCYCSRTLDLGCRKCFAMILHFSVLILFDHL